MCSCSVKDFLGSVNSIFLMKLNVIYHYYISNTVTHFFLNSNDSLEISIVRTLPKIFVMIKIDLGMFERI